MKLPAPRRAGLLTGREAFRLASLCLYVTLLLHAVLAAAVHRLPLSASGIGAVAALALLFQNALLRYCWPGSFCAQRVPAEAELGAAAAVVICLTLLQHAPAQALPWLYAVARKTLANERRKRHEVPTTPDSLQAVGEPEPLADPQLAVAFAALSDADREILRLVAWEGLPLRDAARALECSPVAARVRFHRAKARLRERLETSSSFRPEPKGAIR